MHITLLTVGKTDTSYLISGIEEYRKRLRHYVRFDMEEIAALRKTGNMPADMIKQKEAALLMPYLQKAECVVLLDEKGTMLTSDGFSGFLQKRMNAGLKHVVFVVGGAWGFDESIYKAADFTISLSKMTFSHQMVRLFFVEQLYRAFTILKGERYHNP